MQRLSILRPPIRKLAYGLAAIALCVAAIGARAQDGSGGAVAAPAVAGAPDLEKLLNDGFEYRPLGPYRAGAWISCLAVPDKPAAAREHTIYVGARNGGVWKTVNGGTTFDPIFDGQDVLSIGAVAVAPSDENIVWVGTGEQSQARGSMPGDGVYKSTDVGKTWKNMGLKDTEHIARIVVDPSDPNIVYAAAMGHLFSKNDERGVFKSSDGGATWRKVLFVDNETGAIDLVMDRAHPATLYAAMYECLREPWALHDGGPSSGIYKSSDAGRTWTKLGGGLPSGEIGRIGIDLAPKESNIVYAVIDNRNPRAAGDAAAANRAARGAQDAAGTSTANGRRGRGGRNGGGRDAGASRGGRGGGPQLAGGEVYRSEDGGATWHKMNATANVIARAGYSFAQLRVDPADADTIYVTGSALQRSTDGGRTFVAAARGAAGAGGAGAPQADARPFSRAFGDFRCLWIDPADPSHMIAGTDGGVFASLDGGRTCSFMGNLPLGEVYSVGADRQNNYNIYMAENDHGSWRGPANGWSGRVGMEDWTTVGSGGDRDAQVAPTDGGWVRNSPELATPGKDAIAPPQAAPGDPALRWGYDPPVIFSTHDPKTVYTGAQRVFRSRDAGLTWEPISGDLTGNQTAEIGLPGGNAWCTIASLSESPQTAGVVWAGSDDGKVQLTRDGGAHWSDVTPALAAAGAPADAAVSRVVASRTAAGTAYVAKSRRDHDDFRPFLYKTTDFGATWTPLVSGLPQRSINVIAEDSEVPSLLFAGTDAGVYVSLDAGSRWTRLAANMPASPAMDLLIQPKTGDLVVGSYGRSLWTTNITPLRGMNIETLSQNVAFFPAPWRGRRSEGAYGRYPLYGDNALSTPNEPNGVVFTYYLKHPLAGATITVVNAAGAPVQVIPGPGDEGLNQVVWNLLGRDGLPVAAGDYKALLEIGSARLEQPVHVLPPAPPEPGRSVNENFVPNDAVR